MVRDRYILLYLVILLCFVATFGVKFATAHDLSHQIIIINQLKTSCTLMSGEIDVKKHTLQLEFYNHAAIKTSPQYVCVAESIKEFSDLRMIDSYKISLDKMGSINQASFSNTDFTKGKTYIMWINDTPIKTLSSDQKMILLEKAKAILAEQNRLICIEVYKSIDEMVNEVGKNYIE